MKHFYLGVCCVIVCLLGCEDNREKEARTLLNQAIQEWDSGQLKSADTLFQTIGKDYPDTQVATEALNARQIRRDKYQENLSKQRSKGPFAQIVVAAINAYYKKISVILTIWLCWTYFPNRFLTVAAIKKAYLNWGLRLIVYEQNEYFRKCNLLSKSQCFQHVAFTLRKNMTHITKSLRMQ